MKNKLLNSPRYVAGFVLLLIALGTSYLVYTNPNLNMAALFNSVVTGEGATTIYMPSYEAELGEDGVMEIKAKADTLPFDSLSFVMNYTPVDALTFTNDSILFDPQTLFQNASVKKSTLKEPGTVEITIVLNAPVSVQGVTTSDPATHKTLFKLNTHVSDTLKDADQVKITFKDFAAANGNDAMDFPQLPATTLAVKEKTEQSDLTKASITTVEPKAISNKAETTVTLTGENLSVVKKVWIGTNATTILNQSATSISIKVPAGIEADKYDVVLFDEVDKTVSFNDLLTIGDTDQVEQVSPDAPKIDLDRSYTNPTNGVNDGKTPLTLYTFVEDTDLKSVIANLTNIGQVGAENGGVLGEKKTEDLKKVTCPSDSTVIVCMKPSIKEGSGQWFILSDITISKSVETSQTPYEVSVLAIDEKGNTSTQMLPVYVGSETDTAAPKALVAVATAEDTLEILFNKEIDPDSVSGDGENFTISSQLEGKDDLSVTAATVDVSGKIVTLTTDSQASEAKYSLSVSSDIKDLQGKSVSNATSKLNFDGFTELNKSPLLDYISTKDTTLVELEFQNNLKLSSILALKIKIYSAEDIKNELKIKTIRLLSSNVIQVETENQTPEKRYRISLEGLMSYDGTALPVPINKGFKGYNAPLIHQAAMAHAADFNNDGQVDFSDFTIFSSVYGTVYGTSPSPSEGGGQN